MSPLSVLQAQLNYTTPHTFSHLAGSIAGPGSADGTGPAAQFSVPEGVASDSAANVYVAYTGNNTIRKITPDGVVTTFAGSPGESGSTDGTGSAARFDAPQDLALNTAGNVYVADLNNTIRKITPTGIVSTLAGTLNQGNSGSVDGTGSAVRFVFPQGVAVDCAGNVYVADTNSHTIRIRAGRVWQRLRLQNTATGERAGCLMNRTTVLSTVSLRTFSTKLSIKN